MSILSYRQTSEYRKYREYLKSDEWKELRRIVLDLAQNTCEECGRASLNLEVHHIHYETLFDEDPTTDLQALCRTCHEAADADREYTSGLTTFVRKKYGWDCEWWQTDRIPEWMVIEFEQWLEEQGSDN